MSDFNHAKNTTDKQAQVLQTFLMPVDLIKYLAQDAIYRNKKKLSRLQAFVNLLSRLIEAKADDDTMAANLAQLSEAWGWSRPGLVSYLNKLKSFGILQIDVVVINKVVSLKPQLLVDIDFSKLTDGTSLALSAAPRPLSTHISSCSDKSSDQGQRLNQNRKK